MILGNSSGNSSSDHENKFEKSLVLGKQFKYEKANENMYLKNSLKMNFFDKKKDSIDAVDIEIAENY